jgi:hypothetical protein
MNILDFLKEKEELVVQKYVGEYDLKDFLSKSIQRLGHVQAIVIDRTCLINTEETIINAIQAFKPLSKIKIVFYCPNEEQSLVHELIGLGIFNIITESEVDKLKQEIEMCLLEDMTEKYIKDKFDIEHDVKEDTVIDFKGKQITIGVAGSQHRVGTTTVAMQFACYLSSIGAKVSYVEANDSGHMKLIAEYYKMERIGEGYLYKGVAFESLNSKNKTAFECVVYDLGVFNKNALIALENVQIPIICGGDKVFEQDCMEIISKKIVNHYFKIINFSEEKEGGYYLKYEPCLFRFLINERIYQDILYNLWQSNINEI